ncbi:MAG: DNA repair protein RadA [Halanaerobiales bacterium]|nr:DNA repair protein RadA [Halanaerobiales bacterium]
MSKNKKRFVCQNCGYKTENWMGKCSNCGEWNTIKEVVLEENTDNDDLDIDNFKIPKIESLEDITGSQKNRIPTSLSEFDRVLGGGIVEGSLILIGGSPGIGKSTLILQVAFLLANQDKKVLYITGEESVNQVKMRAERLDAVHRNIFILSEIDYKKIKSVINKNDYDLVIIDSIQTVKHPGIDSSAGSVNQIKEVSSNLFRTAKETNLPIIIIGHITKEGNLAGPKVLEHIVDTVIQMEGDQNYSYRIVRGLKNRFGSTDEMGIFKMKKMGLQEVKNPSQIFINERPENASGSIIVPIMDGNRVILIEIQALVTDSAYSTPQRLTTGINKKRLSILLAVLEKKLGFNFKSSDVHVNITGGLYASEPAIDLGIVFSVISSFNDFPVDSRTAVLGEVGLTGEIRAINMFDKRIKELKKLGFKNIVVPSGNVKDRGFDPALNLLKLKNLKEALDLFFNY